MPKMTKQEFQDLLTQIGTCADETDRRELLSRLHDDGSTIFDDYDAAETALAAAVEDNEKLRQANMRLFLRVGDHTEPEPPKTPTPDPDTPKLRYEDLFNEKGELK